MTDKKDREQQRAHELEMMRMKRDEAERVRWHQREMLRLRIQLIRAERGQAGSTSTPGAAPTGHRRDSVAGPTGIGVGAEEEIGVAGIGGGPGVPDDLSMEGDGEGELDEDMPDQEPPPIITPAASSTQPHPVPSVGRMQGPASSSSRGLQQPPHR